MDTLPPHHLDYLDAPAEAPHHAGKVWYVDLEGPTAEAHDRIVALFPNSMVLHCKPGILDVPERELQGLRHSNRKELLAIFVPGASNVQVEKGHPLADVPFHILS
jgi:hypothetical protein